MDNNNLIIAVILSILILAGFQYLYVKPQQERYRQQVLAEKLAQPGAPGTPQATPFRDRAALIAGNPRIPIVTPELQGSGDLKGAQLDNLSLTHYRESVGPDAPHIILLSPADSAPPHQAYLAEFSWLGGDASVAVPTADTEWK